MDLKNPKTILVIQIGKIGDMILTTPLFSGLKELFPTAKLKVLSSPVNKEIALKNSSVDEVIVYSKNFLKDLALLASLRGKTDILIDIKEDQSTTSSLLVKAINPGLSLGFNHDKDIFDISLKDYVTGDHGTDIALTPLKYLSGKANFSNRPSFNIPLTTQEKMNNIYPGNIDLLINISAGTTSRYIDKDIWLDAINRISKDHLSVINIIGLDSDSETINYLMQNSSAELKHIKTDNIIEVAVLVKKSGSVITPDTSIIHICSVFNIPVLGLYPDVDWNLKKFRPMSDIHEVVISKDKDSLKGIDEKEIAGGYFRLLDKINKT